MKSVLAVGLICLAMLVAVCGRDIQEEPGETGMTQNKTYYFGLITRGESWSPEVTDEVNRLQEAHLANITRLADSGLLALAGPFFTEDNSNTLRGLFIFDVDSTAEAVALCDTDPAVQAGRLKVDIVPWIAPPGLTYGKPIEMTTYVSVLYEKGDAWESQTEEDFDRLVRVHEERLKDVSDSGRVVMAGSFSDPTGTADVAGFLVAQADSLGQWQEIVSSLPEVATGKFKATVLNWYGPVGLGFEGDANEQ
jgi:uncharacterized protein YciI